MNQGQVSPDNTVLIGKYERGLKQMWKDNPCFLTQRRYDGFVRSPRLSRLLWINWVERNAEKIDWCAELVATTVTTQLIKD